MGEVYCARDTKLGRQVALKVVLNRFANDADRLARFQREAQVLAALNHPNIAAIYGLAQADGVGALVMELVDGPTLADRIAQGPLPIDEALAIATQIAAALEAAHSQGIIHRDLKPANIKVRDDGTVKVLDFGLAKLVEPSASRLEARAQADAPTITSPALMTGADVLLGTAAYMAPEQARGKAVDKRADIWAFGCVLFEMLTGCRAFAPDDDNVSDVLAAVIKSDPAWSALPASAPAAIQRLLRRCLAKDPRERLHDMADARLEIRDAAMSVAEQAPATRDSSRLAWTLVAALALLSLALAILFLRSARPPLGTQAVFRSVILPPIGDANLAASEARTGRPRSTRGLALSPDGERLALVAPGSDGRLVLWIHTLDGSGARALTGTEGASSPFWSADGRSLAFVADSKLKRVEASGGPVVTLHEGASDFSTGTWNRDNIILFGDRTGSIQRISAAGGDASPVTARAARVEAAHESPFFLPDGRRFLYSESLAGGTTTGGGSVYVGSLDSQERTKLFDGGYLPAYANGFLLFVRDDTLMAQGFDAERLELTDEPRPLAEQLMIGGAPSAGGVYAVAQSGVLVYRAGVLAKSELVWLDSDGRELGTLGEPGGFSYLQLSPDQRQLAVSVTDDAGRTRDVWLYDTTRGARTRLTAEPSDDFSAVWAPGGDRLAFTGRRTGDLGLNLYETSTSGVGGEKRLLDREGVEIPSTWSPDGQFLLFQTPSPGADIMSVSLAADAQVAPFAATRFTEGSAQFSPDGRWVAYSSNETGRTEVYVVPFRRAGPRVPVSTDGGGSPRWRHDGRELFYIRGDNTLIAVTLRAADSSIEVVAARPLFQTGFHGTVFPYAVASDGRFLVNRSVDDAAPPITLVVNWPAALTK
jgi:serine/threonine protein kinase/Tol biopolymer transport system component